MKKLMQYLKIVVIVIIALEVVIQAGCNTVNNTANINSTNDAASTADINSSYDAIKTAYADNPSNGEISFIYDAINNRISEYPKTVPDFVDLPIDSIIDAIGTSERIHIEYADDDDFENGIIIAQEPAAGVAWDDGIVVNLKVNRKYGSVNSRVGYMGESLGKLCLLSGDYDSNLNFRGTIWVDGERLVDDEINQIYADNGNFYYSNSSGVNRLNGECVFQASGKEQTGYAVMNGKIYYIDGNKDKTFCYNINDKTNTCISDEPMMFIVNSDYIVFRNTSDILIMDNKSYKTIKRIHSEKMIVDFSLDRDNVYFVQLTFYDDRREPESELIKYNIKQDTQTTVLDSNKMVSNILAIDDKIVFFTDVNDQIGIGYIDMRNMENKYFTVENDDSLNSNYDVIDILFDGQRIFYKERYRTLYAICIFTGETKKIELN